MIKSKVKEVEENNEVRLLAKYIEKFYEAVMKERPEIKVDTLHKGETEVEVHEKNFTIFPDTLHKSINEFDPEDKNWLGPEFQIPLIALAAVASSYAQKIILDITKNPDLLHNEQVKLGIEEYYHTLQWKAVFIITCGFGRFSKLRIEEFRDGSFTLYFEEEPKEKNKVPNEDEEIEALAKIIAEKILNKSSEMILIQALSTRGIALRPRIRE
jgi:hypothetical protein